MRIVVVGNEEDAHDLHAALGELLARLHLVMRFVHEGHAGPPAGATPPCDERAEVRIEMRTDDIVLRVAVPAGPSATSVGRPERHLARARSREVDVEDTAEAAYDVLESVLDSGRVPRAPAPCSSNALPAPPDARSPANRDEPPPALELDAGASLALRSISRRTPTLLGVGGAIELGVGHGPGHVSLSASVGASWPFDVPGPGFTLETTLSSLRAVPTIEILGGPVRLDAGVGGGIDFWSMAPRDVRPPTMVNPGGLATDGVLTGRVLAITALSSGAAVSLGLDADYDPAPHAYAALARTGRPPTVFQPYPVRGAVLFGLAMPLVHR